MKNPPAKAGYSYRLAMTEPRLALGLCLDRREGFLCEILVKVTNLGRLGDKRFERRLGVLSRQFQELLRRLHASELFKVRLAGLKRRLRIIGLGGGDGSQVLLDAGKINHWNSLFSHGAVPVGAQPIGVSGASDQKIVHCKTTGSYARAAGWVNRRVCR